MKLAILCFVAACAAQQHGVLAPAPPDTQITTDPSPGYDWEAARRKTEQDDDDRRRAEQQQQLQQQQQQQNDQWQQQQQEQWNRSQQQLQDYTNQILAQPPPAPTAP